MFKNLFTLPGPKDLGKSDSNNYLPIKGFSKSSSDYTWDDYYEDIAKLYPIRNFLFNTIPDLFDKYIVYHCREVLYYLQCHLLPNKKYHLLDLRQPKNADLIDSYRYGYIPSSIRMTYAIFNLLEEYVNKQVKLYSYVSNSMVYDLDEDEHQKLNNEAKNLLYWWKVTRKEKYKSIISLENNWYELRLKNEKELAAVVSENINRKEQELQNETESMCIKVILLLNKV